MNTTDALAILMCCIWSKCILIQFSFDNLIFRVWMLFARNCITEGGGNCYEIATTGAIRETSKENLYQDLGLKSLEIPGGIKNFVVFRRS